jgi:predicted XRE-type DNA-binding protein
MKSKQEFATAINQVMDLIKQKKKDEKIDMELFSQACIKEFDLMDLPFFSIAPNPNDANRISLECPFMRSCHIQIEQHTFSQKEKAAVLYVNGKSVRKIKLQETSPDYMKRVAHALLDYLKRYLLMKNKFLSKS